MADEKKPGLFEKGGKLYWPGHGDRERRPRP